MARYRGQSGAVFISMLVWALAAMSAEAATPPSRAAEPVGNGRVESPPELPPQLIRRLHHGSATGQRHAIEMLRTEHFENPRATELLVELGDHWIQIEGNQAVLLSVIETLGIRPPDDHSRAALLRWLAQCLQIPQATNESTPSLLTGTSPPDSESQSARIDATPTLSEWSSAAPRQHSTKSALKSAAPTLTRSLSSDDLDLGSRIASPDLWLPCC